jgi:hypothetical protein
MFLATLVTDRPKVLQVQQWAMRDGIPYRAHLLYTSAMTSTVWRKAEVLVVDVLDVELLTELYGPREGMTILVGIGDEEEVLMVEFYRAGYSNGSSRLDRYDPRMALMAILDRIRRGEFRSIQRVLTRA